MSNTEKTLQQNITELATVFAAGVAAAVQKHMLQSLFPEGMTPIDTSTWKITAHYVPEIVPPPQEGEHGPDAAPAVPVGKKTRRALMTPEERRARYGQPCAWKGCRKNLSPRTRPYCGEHAKRAAEKKPRRKGKARK